MAVVGFGIGQQYDGLPPASYQHTPSGGEGCVCQCSKVVKGGEERGGWEE